MKILAGADLADHSNQRMGIKNKPVNSWQNDEWLLARAAPGKFASS
jgi:hypothetical protein